MKTFTKTMKLVCKRIVVLLMALCLMTTGSVFLGAFCKNNIAAAEEATEPVWTVLDDGDWATLQAKLFEGGYYKLNSDFIDTSLNSGKSGTCVDFKAVYNVDKYAFAETVPENSLRYPFYSGCGPLLIVKDTTIDLNGKTIDRNRGSNFHTYGMVFWIKNGAKLTIIDSSTGKSGVITGAKNKGSDNAANENLKIDQQSVYDYFDQELKKNETNNGVINPDHVCQVTYGGAFYVEDGTLDLKGGTVEKNGDSYMNGAKGIGAGIYIGAGSTFNMSSDAVISNNTSYGNNSGLDSAIYAEESATVGISLNITIAGKHNETEYDGKKHTVSNYTVESNLGESVSLSSWVKLNSENKPSATQKDVGIAVMGLQEGSFTIPLQQTEGKNIGSFTVTPQQKIDEVDINSISVTVVDGYQKITKNEKPIVITSSTKRFTYDGLNHTDESYTVSYNNVPCDADASGKVFTLPTGDKVSISSTAIGVKDYKADYSENNTYSYTLTNADFYTGDITADVGTLRIDKRSITLKANDASSEYNGSGITYATATSAVPPYYSITNTAENEGLAPGQSITSIELSGNGTAVYEYTINITPDSVKIGNYTSNYNISLESGTLSITKNTTEITVTPGSDSKVYDGTPLTKNGHDDFTVTGVPEGFTWTAKANGTVTNVTPGEGEKSENAVTEFKIFNANGEDVTEQFSNIDTSATGTLTITPKAVTVTAKSEEFTYDGTAHSNDGYAVVGLVGNDKISAVVDGSISFPSESPVTNEVTTYEFSTGTPGNYSVTTENGQLSMKKASVAITIKAASQEWTYDRSAHSNTAVTVTSGSLLPGDELVATTTGSVTNVSDTETGNNPIAADYKVMHGDIDVTENYVITAVAGTLTIYPITDTVTVTVLGNAEDAVYDGNEHSVSGYEVMISNPLYIESDIEYIGIAQAKGTDAGEYPMWLKPADFANISGNFTNVYFVTIEGFLRIKEANLTISAKNQTYTYNGGNQGPAGTYKDSFDTYVNVEGLAEGDRLTSITLTGVRTDADTYTGVIVPDAAQIGDKTKNYLISYVNGDLTIAKRSVTLTSESGEKEYDGTPLTKPSVMVSGNGFVDGEVSEIKATGSVTTVTEGEILNTIEYTEGASFNSDNYTITLNPGTLTITAKEAALTWSDTEFPYDGKSHLPVATVSNLVDGDTCEVTVDGAQTKIGDAYTANATALSNPNYKLPADATTTFKIYGCTITFVDEDGTELQSSVVEYGTKPSYTGKTPVKAATAQYSYEFLDWSPTITEVNGDKTYIATYKPILNAYTVTWKDEDGTVLETDKDVHYGTVPTYDGKEPTKAATAEYSFKFDGWSIAVAEVTGDITYTATYAKSAIEYTVEAENLPEGTQLSFSGKETVEAGKVLAFKVLLADGYEASDDLVVTVNGTKIAPNADGSYTIPSIMTNSVISVTGVVKVDYNLTEGENAEYKQGDSKNARFVFKRTVNDKVTFGRFTYAELDGKLLDPNNYTKVSGSLILELKKEFLDTLPVGEHLLKVYFSDDKEGVIAHFLISAGITPTVTVTVTPAPDSNPTTGDTSNPILWIILIAAAVLGLIGVIYSRSRQEM